MDFKHLKNSLMSSDISQIQGIQVLKNAKLSKKNLLDFCNFVGIYPRQSDTKNILIEKAVNATVGINQRDYVFSASGRDQRGL